MPARWYRDIIIAREQRSDWISYRAHSFEVSHYGVRQKEYYNFHRTITDTPRYIALEYVDINL